MIDTTFRIQTGVNRNETQPREIMVFKTNQHRISQTTKLIYIFCILIGTHFIINLYGRVTNNASLLVVCVKSSHF